jgi:hypothetical protein
MTVISGKKFKNRGFLLKLRKFYNYKQLIKENSEITVLGNSFLSKISVSKIFGSQIIGKLSGLCMFNTF